MLEYLNRAGDFIETNKFSYLAQDNPAVSIIFCKTDFLFQEFERIKNLDKKVILITGNSDYPITKTHADLAPENLIRLYGQNVLCNDDRFVPVPMGLASSVICRRSFEHGVWYDWSVPMQHSLFEQSQAKSSPKEDLFLYFNCGIHTNPNHRGFIHAKIQELDFVNYSAKKSFPDFFQDILDHKMTICPAGNGLDTHRLWEVLYLNRVPVVILTSQQACQGGVPADDLLDYSNYSIYKNLYSKLPIVILNDVEDLQDKNLIEKLYNEAKNKSTDLAYFSNWKKIILNDFESEFIENK
jgi:hypothetical protein